MLVNKTQNAIVVQYNGIQIDVPPGGNLDVREFDISTGQTKPLPALITPVENHIQKEHPGMFDRVKTIDDPKIEREYSVKIINLQNEVDAKGREIEELRARLNEAEEKNASDANQINAFGTKEQGYKDRIFKLEADLKNTIEENDAQMARVRGGKAAKDK